MYIIASSVIYSYNTESFALPTSANHTAITSASTNTEFWVDINSMTADDASNDGSVYYAVSTDDRTTWKIIDDAEGAERAIVRNNGGTWEINDASDYGTETWVAASENDEFYALEEAVDADTAQVSSSFDLENASYDNVSFDVSGQDSFPCSIKFNNDGSKMYVVGRDSDSVYEYDLSVSFDITSSAYNSVSFDVSGQDTLPQSLAFNADGTRMYILGTDTDSVYQYSLSTGFDLSTASYDSVSLDVSGQDTDVEDILFNEDGKKMYMVGIATDSVYQYSLSSAFDLSTASYNSISFDVSQQTIIPKSIAFNNQGTKLYVASSQNKPIFEYDLTAPFDLNSATYNSVSFDFLTQDFFAQDIVFNSNGTKMYMVGADTDSVYEYSTSSATSTNRMDSDKLNAVSDANHYTLGDDLDLAVTLTMPDSGSTSPTSDGVSINYDAQAKNAGAILGTDYEWDRPAADTVNFKALSNENFKIRVV